MDRSMLPDDHLTVDGHHFPIGEGLADDADGLAIEVGLPVGGTEHSPVQDEEVGIRRW